IPDHLIADYFEYLTDVPDEDVAQVREAVEKRTGNPMEAKKRLAHELVTQFHDATAADGAQEYFERTFSKGELPDDVPEVKVSFGAVTDDGTVRIPTLLIELGLTESVSAGSRLFKQGAVEVDGEVAEDLRIAPRDGMIIRVGKHRFVRLLNADA
ncbi:MAG TPA: tyrosine--tRNA ligase, partial [Dehalococcoidia bacterium]